jgi:TPP-dependent pyruvate/acetoin dehydrogenase alpha subunit
MYETWLETRGISRETLENIESQVIQEVQEAEAAALRSREENMPIPEMALGGVYATPGLG